jgi:outer membrane protein TolC
MRLPTIIACLFTIVTTAETSAQPSPEQAASPTGLTADQVAEAAVARSPDLAARRADVRAAAAGVRHALDAYIPHVKLAAQYVRLSRIDAPSFGNIVVAPSAPAGALPPGATLVSVPLAFPVLLDQTTFDAQIDVPVSDYVLRLAHVVAAARHSEYATRLLEAAEHRRVAADARVAYYTWARAKLEAVVAADAVHQADLHLADVQHRLDADRANRADVMRVESQRAAAEQLRVRADNFVEVAETDLRIRLGAPMGKLDIGEDLSADLPLAAPGKLDDLVAIAIAHRPELRALGDDASALREQAKATWAAALPRLDLIGDLAIADPNPRYVPAVDQFRTAWSIGATLTWTLGDTPRQLAAANQLRARADGVDAQRAKLIDGVRLEVAQAIAAVGDAIAAQDTTKRGLASAEESYRVRRAVFLDGRATSTELTDAETELTRARLDAIDARIEARTASVRLTHALGRDREIPCAVSCGPG